MQEWWMIFQAVLAVFAVVTVGGVLRRANWLTEATDRSLMRIIIRVMLPCLVLSTMLKEDLLATPSNLLWPPLVGMATVLLGFAVAWLLASPLRRWLHLDSRAAVATFVLGVGVYNYGYVPIPLVQSLYPDDAGTLSVLFIHNVGVEVIFYGVGIALLAGLTQGWWKKLINPPLVAVAIAIALNLVGLREHMPTFLMKTLATLGAATVPMALLLIGATIADQFRDAKGGLGLRMSAAAVLLRLGVLPALFLLIARYLPCSVELKRVIIVQAAMPCAIFPIVLAKHYGGVPAVAVRIMLATSLLGLLTIPLWLAVGKWFVGVGP
jgi:predicted permease